ncbi:MAG: hypothetical protein ACOX9C_11260 [Kiritimatiellia bacterium]|jgi:hypothetical protein|uniref:hypothetical protein n=1 Tax=Atribacter sp. TaxID=2847780 RepID=UPI003D97D431
MSESEETRQETPQGSLPEDIAQALRRYLEIQEETAALQAERHELRDQIAAYMASIGATTIAPVVDGTRVFVRNNVKQVIDYNEDLLKERLGPDYRLTLWPDPDKIKRNLPKVATLLLPIIEEIGSPSPEAIKAAINGGKLRKEQFDGAFERRQTQSFAVARERGAGGRVGEDDADYDADSDADA